MRYITLLIAMAVFCLSPAKSFAQSNNEEADRWSKIKFLNKQYSKRLQVTLTNNQEVVGDYEKTFYDYFVLSVNGIEQNIQFSDVKEIRVLKVHRTFKQKVGRILIIPLYAAATIIGAPGGVIFYLYCAIDPGHCR